MVVGMEAVAPAPAPFPAPVPEETDDTRWTVGKVFLSLFLFLAAGLAEIGGGWLVWQVRYPCALHPALPPNALPVSYMYIPSTTWSCPCRLSAMTRPGGWPSLEQACSFCMECFPPFSQSTTLGG